MDYKKAYTNLSYLSIYIIQNTLSTKTYIYTFVLNCAATHIHAEPPEGEVQEHGALGPHAEGGN